MRWSTIQEPDLRNHERSILRPFCNYTLLIITQKEKKKNRCKINLSTCDTKCFIFWDILKYPKGRKEYSPKQFCLNSIVIVIPIFKVKFSSSLNELNIKLNWILWLGWYEWRVLFPVLVEHNSIFSFLSSSMILWKARHYEQKLKMHSFKSTNCDYKMFPESFS